ncbi:MULTISPECIES: phospholipase D family protein [Ralstonia solanacearum species complex]|uniref:phospholipase D family nuclease n=1 Tax=Ralstonia solanacearum species complex TaxID=3116862 RepID=UPI00078B4FFB|nr:phospholipase D family protein [Ralstonia solanacearum]AMP36847.1 endonuclease [Ralstonia solanacearum]AXV76290.1 phospholipase D family protein [Ralstonia solanacearum]AXV85655.1 phospholipase D family protein [Ralstonia solanacearum]AXV90299.1 phospholipase D family protein [Ralstonia solanacearum]AXW05164.1 phospholipase D family protein [Ralstonia solanacearum]
MRARRLGLALAAWLALATGGAALARVEPPVLPAKGTVQAVFTPDDDAEGLLADAIDQAREQVLVQAYLLSNKVITRALLDAHGRGIDVRVLADREQMMRSGGSRVPELAGAGVPVSLEVRYKNAHNKVIVIDPRGSHPVLVTGSFNFTQTAQRDNAENVLIVRGDADLAQRYAANWQKHAADALPYKPD